MGTATPVGCLWGTDEPAVGEEFEDGLDDRSAGAAIGPEVDLEDFDWELGVSDRKAATGDRSLRIWNQGDYDDGGTWGTHPVPVTSGQAYR